MKRLVAIAAFALIALSSCYQEADIIRKLTDEEAAVIPYEKDQVVKFIDQNDDTIVMTVTSDVICRAYGYDFDYESKMIEPDPYCYMRYVMLTATNENSAQSIELCAFPEKKIRITFSITSEWYIQQIFGLQGMTPQTLTLNGVDYDSVYVTENPTMAYSVTEGLLMMKTDSCSYVVMKEL